MHAHYFTSLFYFAETHFVHSYNSVIDHRCTFLYIWNSALKLLLFWSPIQEIHILTIVLYTIQVYRAKSLNDIIKQENYVVVFFLSWLHVYIFCSIFIIKKTVSLQLDRSARLNIKSQFSPMYLCHSSWNCTFFSTLVSLPFKSVYISMESMFPYAPNTVFALCLS